MTRPRDRRTIQTEFSTSTTRSGIVLESLVDTGADITCIPSELAVALGLPLDDRDSLAIQTVSGRQVLKTARLSVRLGKTWLPHHRVLIVPALAAPLLGWDILGDSSVFAAASGVLFGEAVHLLASLPSFKEKAVLVLGQDTTEIHRLRAIQNSVGHLGYEGLVVKDISDIDIQSIEEKVNMLASLCRFVICDNSVASGHIDELKICANNRFVTAIVQQDGMGATWMQADYSKDFAFMETFTYRDVASMDSCIQCAAKWAEDKVEDRRQFFNNLYHWR